MATPISAQEGALREGYVAVEEATGKIKNHVSNVDNTLQALRGAWTGDASNVYNTLVLNWQQKANELNNTLRQLQQSLQETEKAQIESEHSHEEAVSNIAKLLS